MRRLILLALLLVCGAPCAWAQLSVISPRPESVTITAYRQGIAQITESRQVELPAGPVTLVFEGVVDTLLPQSALISGTERAQVETNFDYDRLSPASLLERSVGQTVTLVRTNRRTGAVTRQAATIVSASGEDGVVFRTVEGNEAFKCSGLPERLEFNEMPAGLRTTPTLSVRLAAGLPGKRSVTLSYLVHGITWSADYVAKLNQKADRMDLAGWVTLTNDTSVNFDRAQVQLISGELEVVGHDDGGSRPDRRDRTADRDGNEPEIEKQVEPAAVLPFEKCTPPVPPEYTGLSNIDYAKLYPYSVISSNAMMTIAPESLGDYVLYRLPELTDLKARQTKQVMFLHKPRVQVERFYLIWSHDFTEGADDEDDDFDFSLRGPEVGLGWRNDSKLGLGEPLPEGTLRIFERFSGREVFAGDAGINDIPVGLSVVVFYARAQGVADDRIRTPEPESYSDEKSRLSVTVEHHLANDKRVPVTVVVVHMHDHDKGPPRLLNSNMQPAKADGDPRWLVRMPAGSRRVLRYELEVDNPDYDPPED